MNISISLIIPTLNRSKLLKRALRSVFCQTLVPQEIIVIDNGSNDNTLKMIKENFCKVKYIFYDDKGVSKARNLGIKTANNELICFLDSDDEWKPDKIKKQIDYFYKNRECKFLHTDEIWHRNGIHFNQSKKHLKKGGYLFENCLKMCCISPSSAMIHKSIFDYHGMFDENLEACEDYDMWLRISSREKIYFVDEKLVIKHGGHDDQLSKKYWGMDRFRVYSIEKNINNNKFNKTQTLLAIKYMLEKIKIIKNGARKRQNDQIFKEYKNKFDYWKTLI